MTEAEKKRILGNLNRIPTENLIEYIISGDISFEEMRETGKLTRPVQEEIHSVISKKEQEEQEEEDFWNDCKGTNTIARYESYIRTYSQGRYVKLAQSRIEELVRQRDENKIHLLNDIRQKPINYPPLILMDLLNSGDITEDDLEREGIITRKALSLYLNPPKGIREDQNSWSNLPPIPDGNTDIYVFGIPGSGKSCVLAGLLYQANKMSILQPTSVTKIGNGYMNELRLSVEIGYVPQPTTEETVNYMSFNLRNKNGDNHPISLVEMSGEFFNRTYEDEVGRETDGNKTIGAKGYLKNNNRKVILFVVDYTYDFHQELMAGSRGKIATQEMKFEAILQKLASDGTLSKTDSVQIILTKSDMMPVKVEERASHGIEFLKSTFSAFLSSLQLECEKYNINPHQKNQPIFHPFSLGRFMMGQTFEFNPTDSEKLVKSIINATEYERKKKWYQF